jgi:hypothetical protein
MWLNSGASLAVRYASASWFEWSVKKREEYLRYPSIIIPPRDANPYSRDCNSSPLLFYLQQHRLSQARRFRSALPPEYGSTPSCTQDTVNAINSAQRTILVRAGLFVYLGSDCQSLGRGASAWCRSEGDPGQKREYQSLPSGDIPRAHGRAGGSTRHSESPLAAGFVGRL